jgi:hypothetical protein
LLRAATGIGVPTGKYRLFGIRFYQLNPHRPTCIEQTLAEPNLGLFTGLRWGIT